MEKEQIKTPEIKKDSIIGGLSNAIINSIISWFTYKDGGNILLSDDRISSSEHTVFANAVSLAVSLAFILTSISYFTWKLPGKPSYFPVVFKMALKHTIFTFGLVVIFAIMFQRIVGSVVVTPIAASVISGIIAGLVGGTVTYLTTSELFKYSSLHRESK